MQLLFSNKRFYIGIAAAVIIAVLFMMYRVSNTTNQEIVTTAVERGTVRQLVSVSGIAEAKQTASLAFPTTGIVRSVHVDEGDIVEAGAVLATLDTRSLYADRQEAVAALTKALAEREQLVTGPTTEARAVTNETVLGKETALATTRVDETRKVENAYQTLLSDDLAALSEDPNELAVAPIVTGTYTCNETGTYTIAAFKSKADSGYSYRYSGLESGTANATTQQPGALGTCGLYLQFDSDSTYSYSVWNIAIPNTNSASYITNKNAHELAVTQADTAIELAEQAVTLAKADATNQNAPARTEAMTKANAAVAQAQATLSRIDAAIADRTLTAPFSGTITMVDITPGETVDLTPVITVLASHSFEMVARIPEIDIGKVLVDQAAEMLFDARTDTTVLGTITFISPQATEIDGVAYYEAIIAFTETPTWMRDGLNADIEIILAETTDQLRVPKRFVTNTESGYVVLLQRGTRVASTTVEVLMEGNDGYYALRGVVEGDTLVAP